MLAFGAVVAVAAEGDVISVRETGAVGDGKADDTAAFEAAIARGKAEGKDVYVPWGRYRITRTLVLKAQSLRGRESGAWVADDVSLPTILPENAEGPYIRMLGGASVHGLHFFYDWKGAAPSAKGPAIELAGVGCRVTDVKIQGAWDGIMADGKNNVGRALVKDCFIVDVHNIGVRMTGTWDVSWISNVEVWSPGSKRFPQSGVGFQFGKNDVLLVSDCFVFTAQTGFELLEEIPGCEIKGVTWGSFSNCATDFCSTGMMVNGAHTISVNGGCHWTHWAGLTVKGKGAQVRVSGLELGANGGPALVIEGGDLVTVAGCQIRRLQEGRDAPAVRITGGDGTAISGCVIASATKAIEIADGVKNVVTTGNVIRENVRPKAKQETGQEAK